MEFTGASATGESPVSLDYIFRLENVAAGVVDIHLFGSDPVILLINDLTLTGSGEGEYPSGTIYPTDTLDLVGGGTTTGATVFGFILDDSDDLTTRLLAESGEYKYVKMQMKLTLEPEGPIPEPSAWMLAAIGLVGIRFLRKRKQR